MKSLSSIAVAIIDNKGITYNIFTDSMPTKGWAVAIQGYEQTFPMIVPSRYKTNSSAIAGAMLSYQQKILTMDALSSYILKHYAILKDKESNHLGAWVDGDNVVLDVTKIIEDKDAAIQFGLRNNQRAIYNIETGETLYLEGMQVNETASIYDAE